MDVNNIFVFFCEIWNPIYAYVLIDFGTIQNRVSWSVLLLNSHHTRIEIPLKVVRNISSETNSWAAFVFFEKLGN